MENRTEPCSNYDSKAALWLSETLEPIITIEERLTLDELKNRLVENGYEETVVFENPDYANAFTGVTEDGRAIYDYDMMVEDLMTTDDMDYEDAAEFISYNTIGSLPYVDNAPIILYRLIN